MNTRYVGLDAYNLSPSRFEALGSAAVRLMIQQRGPSIATLRPHPPATRLLLQAQRLRQGLRRIRAAWTGGPLVVRGRSSHPWSVDGTTSVRNAATVSRLSCVESVFVTEIMGRKRAAPKKTLALFTVRARVAIQVEGQVSGYQTYEERFMLIRAESATDACRRLSKAWREYAAPGVNSRGYLFRWQLEEVLDVYALFDAQLDLDVGAEVYSRLETRRAKGRPVWNPRGAP